MKLLQQIISTYRIAPRHLQTYRVCYCLSIIFLFGVPNYTWVSKNPDYIFNPPILSIAVLSNGFPSTFFFQIISILLCIFFACLLFGFKARLASIGITICMLIGQSFVFSFGKIDHNILMVLLPALLSFSNWGCVPARQDFKNDHFRDAYSLFNVALFLGFAMFSAGIQKILGGWLISLNSATRGHFLANYFVYERQDLLATVFLFIDNWFFWKSLDYLTVLFEVGFLFAIVHVKIFKRFVLIAIIFHTCTLLIFNIPFSGHFIIFLLFIDWNTFEKPKKYLPALKTRTNILTASKNHMMLTALILIIQWYLFQKYSSMPFLAEPSVTKWALSFFFEDIFLPIGVLVVVLALIIIMLQMLASNISFHKEAH